MAKKRIALFLLSSLLLFSCQQINSSTDTSSPSEKESSSSQLEVLATPTITLDEYGSASWNEVPHAIEYCYYLNQTIATCEKPCEVTLSPHSTLSVVALGDNVSFQNSKPALASINTIKLKAPVCEEDEHGTLTYSQVEHALSYQVTIWDKETSKENPKSIKTYTEVRQISLSIGESATVKAIGDQKDYCDSDDSNIVSCHNSGWDTYGKEATDIIETVLGDVSSLPFFQGESNWSNFSLSDDCSIGCFYSTIGNSVSDVNDYIDNTLIPDWSINSTTLNGYLLTNVTNSYKNSLRGTYEGNSRFYTFKDSENDAYLVLSSYVLNAQGHLRYYFSKNNTVSLLPPILPVGKAPIVNIDRDGTAHWNPIEDKQGNCFGYDVIINGNEPIVQKETSYSLKDNDTIKVKLHGDNVLSSSNSPYSLIKTYHSTKRENLSKEELDKQYTTSYFYEQLKTKDNANACLALYDELDQHCYCIFNGDVDSITKEDSLIKVSENQYAVTSYCDSESSLTSDEVDMVYHAYKADHEIYYFLDPDIYSEKEGSNTTYYFLCGEEFIDVNIRNKYRNYLFDSIESYQNNRLASLTKDSEKTKAIHNQILDDIDLAYDENGNPVSSVSAHSIIAGLVTGEGVCEAYARTFDLLMNHFSIETIYVYGMSNTGAGHAWNITNLNSSYYWFDPTWDDTAHQTWYLNDDIKYKYYCIYDGQIIADTSVTFSEQHYAYSDFIYPTVSKYAYIDQ